MPAPPGKASFGALQDLLYLADAHSSSGDRAKAVAELGQLIDQLKNRLASLQSEKEKRPFINILTRAYGSRGVARMSSSSPSELTAALADFDQALQVGHPRPSLILWSKAETLIGLDRYKEAATAYSKASVDPLVKSWGTQKDSAHPEWKNLCQIFGSKGLTVSNCN